MYKVGFVSFGGFSQIPEAFDTKEEARDEAAKRIVKARRKGLTVNIVEKGEEWEVQYEDSGVGDNEGYLSIRHITYPCRECGFACETLDDATNGSANLDELGYANREDY
jgi:hypothetical protein